jgi:hypothetical protein
MGELELLIRSDRVLFDGYRSLFLYYRIEERNG